MLRTRWNGFARAGVVEETLWELIMALSVRFRTALLLATSLALAPAAHAERWHDGDRHHNHHGGGNAAGAAIVGGLIGLGLGAAIASGGGYYAPPPVYYGAPGYYYAPPPPVYYGYGY